MVCGLTGFAIALGLLSIDAHHAPLGAEGLLKILAAPSIASATVLVQLALGRG